MHRLRIRHHSPIASASITLGLIAGALAWMLLGVMPAPVAHAAATISGTVFRDFNANGAKDSSETQGIGGVTVTAYDAANAAQGTATTAADGTYTLNATGNAPYRVEFSGWPGYLQPGAHGTQNNTAVQFVAGSASAIDFALNDPAEYCQANPNLCTSEYTNGDSNISTGPTKALLQFPYAATGSTPAPTVRATKMTIGSVWGLAYGRDTGTIYSAAFLRRHVGLGPGGLSAIYQTTSSGTGLFVDLAALGFSTGTIGNNAARGLGAYNTSSTDPTAYDNVGKIGLGGLTMSTDQKTLWAMNLFDRKLYAIPTTAPTAANVQGYAVPDPGCTGGAFRPFAVKYYHDDVYVGVVCDAQTSQSANDLQASVYKFTAGAFVTTPVVSFKLNYPKGPVSSNAPACPTGWFPWGPANSFPAACYFNETDYPEPLLSGIEFDVDGSMIMAFMDRFSAQIGYQNQPPSGGPVRGNILGGDLLRAYNNNGTFVLENNGATGSLPVPTANSHQNNEGPGGGEFYLDNSKDVTIHHEPTMGGIALLAGSNEVVGTAMGTLTPASAGVAAYSNSTGEQGRSYRIYQTVNEPGTFAKATGLGDVELLCDSAPIEIGNRVWRDDNGNGIQDAGEAGIPGVVVQLTSAAGNPIAIATTDADGTYYFSSAPGTTTGSAKYQVALAANTAYKVQLDTTQPPLNGSPLTTANADAASANADSRDSDATLSGSTAVINVATGNAGANDHSYDFGFRLRYSLGNRVWFDTNNNGLIDNGETGIDGVAVNLFADANGDGVPDSATALGSFTTSNGGYYRFDGLDAGTYLVRVDPINFSSGLLAGYTSSSTSSATPNNDLDNDDNGIDNAAPATVGILSGPITLGPGASEPTGEADLSPGGQGTLDINANMTVDFGFYKLSIGNQLWLDTDNNGVLDNGESGTTLANVRVELRDGATLVAVATTDATGAYLFDRQTNSSGVPNGLGLAPSANYRVVVPASEFAAGKPLANLFSSAGAVAGTDNHDVGVDNATPATNGISSAPFALTPGAATGGAVVTNATGATNNPTLDFGFYTLSLGNRVFYDKDNNGVFDGSDEGLANVSVKLYRDSNNDGTPDGAALATQSTTADGYYLFTGLAADTYIVEITPPTGYRSSVGAVASASGPYEPAPDADANATDADDNGTTSGSVIRSAPVTLAAASEPTGEPTTPGLADPAGDANSNLTVDFGLFRPMNLGNLVWNDANNNGMLDTGEIGIANVAVTLYADANNDGTPDGPALATTTTNASGNYLFTNLVPGTYIVDIAPPAGYHSSTGINGKAAGPYEAAPDTNNDVDGDDNGTTNGTSIRSKPITLALGSEPDTAVDGDDTNGNLSVDFGLFRPASLGDFVWNDANKNGRQDTGEPGVQGVTATLYNAADNSVVDTQTTDANGAYLFDNLVGGSYYVVFSNLPPTYGFVLRDQGSDTQDSDADQLSGKTGNYTLAAGQQNLTVDVGIAVANTLRLGNLLWADYNNNGVVDADEPGVSGVPVELLNAAGTSVLSTVTTDANGNYVFGNLLPGNYRVRIPASAFAANGPLENWHSSSGSSNVYEPAANPDNDIDNDDNGTTTSGAVTSLPVTLTLGGEPDDSVDGDDTNGNLTVDFGLVPDRASLGDMVWYDTTRNNLQDAGEAGVAGVVVKLYKADGTLLETQTTGANGKYLFSNLVPGDYYVVFDRSALGSDYRFVAQQIGNNTAIDSDADRLTGQTSQITLAAGENDLTWDAGVYQIAALGDFVWLDTNANGVQDSAEPGVPAVTVHLLDALGNVIATTVTDANGTYEFTDLEPGNYAVQFVQPAGYAFTTPNSTSANPATDSDAEPSTGNTSVTALAPGEHDTTLDAGLVGAMRLGNLVWDDLNNNGQLDTGETGIANVPATLYQDSNNDGAPDGAAVANTTTDANGNYLFANLVPSTYLVEITPPAGYASATGKNGSASGPYEPAPDANNDVDDDDNGTASNAVIRSGPVALVGGSEPVNDGDTDANSNLAVDFGLFQPASLGSVVWFDTNGDGIKQPDEAGAPNVTVTLYDAVASTIMVTTTDADGAFQFNNLAPGVYSLGFSNLPAGTAFTSANQGNDANDSDADPATGRTGALVLRAGERNLTVFAGLVRRAPTAISLTSFTATRTAAGTLLKWTTGNEIGTLGFHILRSADRMLAHATRVTTQIILAQGHESGEVSYTWIDTNAPAGQDAYYWLEETDVAGVTHRYGPASNGSGVTTARFQVFVPVIQR